MKATALVILFLCSLGLKAQIKIGDITVSEAMAKEYFLDCYTHPDTLWRDLRGFSREDGLRWEEIARQSLCTVDPPPSKAELAQREKENREEQRKDSLKRVNDKVLRPHGIKKTLEGKEYWFSNYSDKSLNCIDTSALSFEGDVTGYFISSIGYVVPRKPSAEDFAKWMRRK